MIKVEENILLSLQNYDYGEFELLDGYLHCSSIYIM